MAQWKSHPLAPEEREQLKLRINARVRATVDLPHVPAGTEGKVLVAAGFNWLRYRVRFDNGEELGHLDGRHLELVGRRR
jgi:hypothetical protein